MDSGLERLLGWKINFNNESKLIDVYRAEDIDMVEIKWILQASFLFIADALEFLLKKIR